MSAFVRFLRPIPASSRAYSSFFSSKPGGGRYFNSAKPPKPVVAGSSAKNSKANSVGSSSSADTPGDVAHASGGNAESGANCPKDTSQRMNATNQSGGQPANVSNPASSASASSAEASSAQKAHEDLGREHLQDAFFYPPQHPVVNPKDFKLHQFFSLHRPLLLLSHPSYILSSVAPDVDPTSSKVAEGPEPGLVPWSLGEFSETNIDADAATARQLARALTINHAGATVAWEDTLRRLGLDVDEEPDRVNMKEQMEREWQEVMMDSVKRKRRKKMKKHKLKKRRKATRAARVKIGR